MREGVESMDKMLTMPEREAIAAWQKRMRDIRREEGRGAGNRKRSRKRRRAGS